MCSGPGRFDSVLNYNNLGPKSHENTVSQAKARNILRKIIYAWEYLALCLEPGFAETNQDNDRALIVYRSQ